MDYRQGLRKSYRDAVVAAYFGQLLEQVLELDHPVPEMFDLLQRGLGYLSDNGADRRSSLPFREGSSSITWFGAFFASRSITGLWKITVFPRSLP